MIMLDKDFYDLKLFYLWVHCIKYADYLWSLSINEMKLYLEQNTAAKNSLKSYK